MRRSGTLGDFSQSVQPQKKSFRKCYSETALGSINPANSDKPPKHPLLGIDVSVFMRPSSNRPADVLQYPQTPREVSLSPTNAFKRSPQQVPSSPSDIPIPPIPKPLLRTKDTEAIQRSSSSESLSSMFEKSTIHGRIGKLPQRTQSMENLQSQNPLLENGATEKVFTRTCLTCTSRLSFARLCICLGAHRQFFISGQEH